MNKIKILKTNIKSFADDLKSVLEIYEILSLYNDKNTGHSIAFYKDNEYITLESDSVMKWIKDENIEFYTEENKFGLEFRFIHPTANYDCMGYESELDAIVGAVEQLYFE